MVGAGIKLSQWLSCLLLIYIFESILTPHTHTKLQLKPSLKESKRNLHFLFYVQLVANVFILVERGGRWKIKIELEIKEWSQCGIFK